MQAECEMVNSGTKPILKLCYPTFYERVQTRYRHLFLQQISEKNTYSKKEGTRYFLQKRKQMLTFSVPGKLKNSILKMPIITQTLNINNLRTTSAKSINLHTIRKLIEYSLKIFRQSQCLLLLFSRYCCPNVGRYCDLLSGAQGAKGLR